MQKYNKQSEKCCITQRIEDIISSSFSIQNTKRHEQRQKPFENAFHAFCKIVLRHEAMNAWRDLKRKEEREISLDYLMSERYFEPSAMDSYFERQDKPTVFLVLGKEVIVDDERLATALSRLPQLRQEVLLLYYFIGYRDEAIGRLYRRCRSTINSRRNVALKQLRKEWERLKHEE